jgi:phosphate transport system permease protein
MKGTVEIAGSIQGATPKERTSGTGSDLSARGEPFLWNLGGALALGILMVFGFLVLIFWNGLITFYPKPVEAVALRDGSVLAGEPTRREIYRPGREVLRSLDDRSREAILAKYGYAGRTLYRTGNFDLYNEDYRWIPDFQVKEVTRPGDIFFLERVEWGPFIGRIHQVALNKEVLEGSSSASASPGPLRRTLRCSSWTSPAPRWIPSPRPGSRSSSTTCGDSTVL